MLHSPHVSLSAVGFIWAFSLKNKTKILKSSVKLRRRADLVIIFCGVITSNDTFHFIHNQLRRCWYKNIELCTFNFYLWCKFLIPGSRCINSVYAQKPCMCPTHKLVFIKEEHAVRMCAPSDQHTLDFLEPLKVIW